MVTKLWIKSVWDACKRVPISTGVFTYKSLKYHELPRIISETGCIGKTPDRTLSRVLQTLRDEEKIIFVDNAGTYAFNAEVLDIDVRVLDQCRSRGEKLVAKSLVRNGITEFEQEKRFCDLYDKSYLRFDFYFQLPSDLPNRPKKCVVEFDGLQHFKSIKCFGGERGFDSLRRRDAIKNRYCKKHNINLLRIRYDESRKINRILSNFLDQVKL